MKVTVVTPVLNGENTIRDCIRSIADQDYPHLEHLVIDGGSTDGTIDILKNENVAYLSEKDAGIYDAFTKGVLMASGEIIHILNADDIYSNRFVVGKVVKIMDERKIDLCHGYIEQSDREGNIKKRVGRPQSKLEMLKKMRVAHPSVFVRKSIYDKFGAFSVGFRVAGDHEFLLRVWDKVTVDFFPEVLVNMRLGGASNSQVALSYRESMAATLLHGASPSRALMRYYWERLKNGRLLHNLRARG